MKKTVLVLCLSVLLLAVPSSALAKDKKDAAYAESVAAELRLGEPLVGTVAIIFPLLMDKAPGDAGVVSQNDAALTYEEPEFPDHRYAVAVTNPTDSPVLLLGGTVLLGGTRDRMIRHDTIIGPKTTVQVRALPAAATSEVRKEPTPFKAGRQIAPVYLRRKADFGGSSSTVTTFISRNLDFRNDGDERKSLEAIGSSSILQGYTEQGRKKLDEALSKMRRPDGEIVGWILALRGRLQSLMVFGDPKVAAGYRGAFLLGATYSAAAIELQAAKKNVPMPGKDDPAKTLEIVTKEAEKLLERLRKGTFKADRTNPEGAVGERHMIQLAGGARGRCVGKDGKLVHMAVYPHDPFSSAFYGSKIELPDEDIMSDPDRIGLAELGRRYSGGARLTEAEKRVLDRVGRTRGGGLGRVGGMGGGPRGGQGGGRRR